MVVPNGVRPDAPQLGPTDPQHDATLDAASDDASDAGSSGWATASDEEEDSTSGTATAPATASSTPSAARSASKAVGKANTAAEESVEPPATPSRGPESSGEAADTATSDNWEDWDLCCSLFDNHKSSSMEANLEYMLKNFGFYMPDAQYLSDPAGLLRYLVRQSFTYTCNMLQQWAAGLESTCLCTSRHGLQSYTPCCRLVSSCMQGSGVSQLCHCAVVSAVWVAFS